MAGFSSYHDALRADLRTQLLAIVGAADIDDRVYWENVGNENGAVEPPTQGSGVFQRVTIDTAANREITAGQTLHVGAVIIEIYDDPGQGPERVEARAEAIAAKLRRRRLLNGMLKFRHHEYKPVGRNEDLARWQGNLRIEFTFVELI